MNRVVTGKKRVILVSGFAFKRIRTNNRANIKGEKVIKLFLALTIRSIISAVFD